MLSLARTCSSFALVWSSTRAKDPLRCCPTLQHWPDLSTTCASRVGMAWSRPVKCIIKYSSHPKCRSMRRERSWRRAENSTSSVKLWAAETRPGIRSLSGLSITGERLVMSDWRICYKVIVDTLTLLQVLAKPSTLRSQHSDAELFGGERRVLRLGQLLVHRQYRGGRTGNEDSHCPSPNEMYGSTTFE